MKSIPESQLVGDTVIEEFLDILTIGSLWSCGQAKQLCRLQMVQNALVGGCLSVVEFINDHNFKVLCFETVKDRLLQ